jgi:hypothetical protein
MTHIKSKQINLKVTMTNNNNSTTNTQKVPMSTKRRQSLRIIEKIATFLGVCSRLLTDFLRLIVEKIMQELEPKIKRLSKL